MHQDEDWQESHNGVLSEDAVLLAEVNHRVANEIAAGLALLYVARASRGLRTRRMMLDQAIGRLEGFGRVHQILSARVPAQEDASVALDRMARATVSYREPQQTQLMELDLTPIMVDGATVRRLLMIAFELINNALKYAFRQRSGRLTIRLHGLGGHIMLVVADDGPGLAASSLTGTGLGSDLVTQLVHRGGGTLECSTGTNGTIYRVGLPFDPASVARIRTRG